jgi:putative membrane protein
MSSDETEHPFQQSAAESEPQQAPERHQGEVPRVPPVVADPLVAGPPPGKGDNRADLLSEPAFLHPSSILFDIASHLRRFLFPAVIAVWSAAQGGGWGVGIAAILFSLALLGTIFRYVTLRYRIQGSDFVVTEGLIFRRVRSVPVRRIQNVDLIQNPLHRLFGVAEVRIETAAGSEPEATLRVLTHAQIEELRQALFGNERAIQESTATVAEPEKMPVDPATAADRDAATDHPSTTGDSVFTPGSLTRASATINGPGVLLHRTPLKLLVGAGLASNRGIVLLGVLVGLFFQNRNIERTFIDDWVEAGWKRAAQTAEQSMPEAAGYVGWGIAAIVVLIAIMLVLRIVGVAWYVLRFYDHRLERHGPDMRISCGLFTRVSATVPRRRIQFISIHRPLLFRWMKLASIRIETAGGGGGNNEDATTTVSRRWFLPVVAESDIPRLIGELRPGVDWTEDGFAWIGVSPSTAGRLLRIAVVMSLLMAALGVYYWRPWGGLGGAIVFPLLAGIAIKRSRAMRYARTQWGVVYRSGLFTRKISMAFYDRIQTLEVAQTPFDRRWKMATLKVDTAAAGPANHTIDARYLDADYAFEQFRELQVVTAHNRPVWG